MLWKKIDKLFSHMSNVFGIADDILFVVFSEWGKDNDKTLEKVLGVNRQTNLNLVKVNIHLGA